MGFIRSGRHTGATLLTGGHRWGHRGYFCRFLNELWDNDDEAMTPAVGAALARETVLR